MEARTAPERGLLAGPGDVITVCPGGDCDHGSIQAAVDAAEGGEIIKVAAGLYDDVHRRETLTQVVYITKSLAIRGGYTTTNGFADPPDPQANATTVDAQGLGRGVYITGAMGVELAGLRVIGGHVEGSGSEGSGGGVYVKNARVVISGCEVYSNVARYSGGIYLRQSPTSTLVGNHVHHNVADWGGGVYLSASGNVTLTNNHISSNTVTSGGGGAFIFLSDGVRWLANDVYSNTAGASYEGGGICFKESRDAWLTENRIYRNTVGYGGGLYFDSDSDRAALIGNRIYLNEAVDYGSGGGALLQSDSVTLSANAIFANTSVDDGGGLYIGGRDVLVDGNEIYSNTTSNWGGGLYLNYADAVTLTDNRLFNNTGERGGGIALHHTTDTVLRAMWIYKNVSPKHGGGLYLDDSHVTVTNTMLTDNFAGVDGGGLYLQNATVDMLHVTLARNTVYSDVIYGGNGIYLNASAAWLTNTIIVSHTVGVEANSGSTATLGSRLWGRGVWANVTDRLQVGGVVITTTDQRGVPAFVDPNGGDYHITRTSAALDAGEHAGVTEDIDGDPRPLGNDYDIGADEYVGCMARLNAGRVYTSVQAAIHASRAVTDVVRIAGACYEHDVLLDRTLTLQGGWNSDFTLHDPEAHPSTLDAQGQGRVLEITAGAPVVEDLHIIHGLLGGGDDGAGVYVGAAAAPTLCNNHLYSNTTDSQGGGGAVYVAGSPAVTLTGNAVYLNRDEATLIDNQIWGNRTSNVSDGGGIAIRSHSSAMLRRNTIIGNAAYRNAGGLFVGDQSDVTLVNNVIADNTCCTSPWAGGAGIWLGNGDHLLVHNTFANNQGGDGAAIRLYGDTVLTNTIVASHTVGLNVVAEVTAKLEGTLWHNNDQAAGGPGTIVSGTVNLHGDPAFVDPATGDYHLQNSSLAIDAGVRSDVGEDIDGDTRPRGLTYDLGADEYPDPVVAPEHVVIAGPDTGVIATATAFTATVSPTNATLPGYSWRPVPEAGQGTRYVTYAWPTGGAKAVTVTVDNAAGAVAASTMITVMPEIEFSALAYSVTEAEGSAVITVSLTAPSDLPIRVDYATSDGTATAGEDYVANSGMLFFAPDVTLRTFDVPILSDAVAEDDETVRLALSRAQNAVLGATEQATLTIRDAGETYIYLPLVLRR